ncbi:MAG: AraC family transcriptional regulator [Bacteroidota bacterium]
MILHEFPDLHWLRRQVEQNFQSRQGWRGAVLPQPGWPSVILQVEAQRVYRDQIVGPVSLFMNRKGSSLVTTGNTTTQIPYDCFFITNQQQEYTLATDGDQPVETFNIHFGERFIDELYYSAVNRSEKLLENPLSPIGTSVGFFNRLHRKDTITEQAMQRLMNVASDDTLLTDEILSELVLHLLGLHQYDLKRMHDLPPVKAATRAEIYRRLRVAVDYMYSFYHQNLALDELAEVALLSKFHFLRLFKAAFHRTPHQFITRLRLDRARQLLQNSSQSVQSIAEQIGLGNASSFSRLFRQQVGVYPTEYRAKVSVHV